MISSFSVGSGRTNLHSLHRWSLCCESWADSVVVVWLPLAFIESFVFLSEQPWTVLLISPLEVHSVIGCAFICVGTVSCAASGSEVNLSAFSDVAVRSTSFSIPSSAISKRWRLSWVRCSSIRACRSSLSLLPTSPPLPLFGPHAEEP